MNILIAVTRGDAASYLNTFFTIYSLMILIRILLSWVQTMPDNQILNTIVRFVIDVTDPYLGLFRRLLRPVQIGGAGIDFSPIVALIVLYVVQGIVVNLVNG